MDEAAQVNHDVLLVVQPGWFPTTAGPPPGIVVHGAQRQPTVRFLEVPHLLVFDAILIDGGLGDHEQPVDLDGSLLIVVYQLIPSCIC